MKTIYLNEELINLPFSIHGRYAYVNYYDDGIQAGFPSPADDFKEQRLSLDEKYLVAPESTFLIKVVGMSMYPTLHVGDILVVRSDYEASDNTVAIISVNNTAFTVKRIDKQNAQLIADNDDFPNIPIHHEDHIAYLGVVKHLIRDL